MEQSTCYWEKMAYNKPHIFAKTKKFKNSFICYYLNNLHCKWSCFCVWLCNPACELPYTNKFVDRSIDWQTVKVVKVLTISQRDDYMMTCKMSLDASTYIQFTHGAK